MKIPGWEWLTNPSKPYTWSFFARVIIKGLFLFALANVVFALLNPVPFIGKLSIYNMLVPGRERLPYGENPEESYTLSINNLEAMFATHAVSGGKANDEYRVLLIGDSSTWGYLLEPENTLAGRINAGDYRTIDGREVVAYNIGYPTMSLTKDLLLLDYAMHYEPDMVVWLVTLESFPRNEQLESPPLQYNPARTRDLIDRYNLDLEPDDERFIEYDFQGRTIVGQRRALADWLRMQMYGVMWALTGIDQKIGDYDLRTSDFDEDITWHEQTEESITDDYLTFDVLAAGRERVGEVPFLLINEPMFISDGRNSNLRYNFFYPRWVYDNWRERMTDFTEQEGWNYLDLWDVIPPSEFTDSPVHLTPAGSQQLSELVGVAIIDLANNED